MNLVQIMQALVFGLCLLSAGGYLGERNFVAMRWCLLCAIYALAIIGYETRCAP